jgi:hypothetical protein
MAGKRSGEYEIKGFVGVTENDWSNKGTRRRAQGSQGLMLRFAHFTNQQAWNYYGKGIDHHQGRLLFTGVVLPSHDLTFLRNFLALL